ncbi:hypothetical protein CQR44_0953 [Bifidobacterium asteroides]|uniref:Uncharacterized protein n=1 Tax=Bifidobacterium asteroides TaxID=1684 RepID=A0A2N3RAB8_9BIFI|nr:hypothetical protein CQR44_0953 [Bifidobacterium asteroides]
MAALQMEIAVYRSGRFGFGRPSTVPCHGAVHAFLHGMAFCIPCTAETYAYPKTYAYPNARSQSSDGFSWQQVRIPYLDSAGSKSGSQTCAQSAMGLDSIWIPHLCSTGNRQPAIGNKYASHIHPSSLYSTDTSQADESSCIPQRFVGLTTQGRAPNLRRSAAESARPCRRRPAPPARWRRRRRRRRPAGRPQPGSCRRPGRPARCP